MICNNLRWGSRWRLSGEEFARLFSVRGSHPLSGGQGQYGL
jgi:hypothetical protein